MTEAEAQAAQAKLNADTIKDEEATAKGARGTEDTEPAEGDATDMPPPHPH